MGTLYRIVQNGCYLTWPSCCRSRGIFTAGKEQLQKLFTAWNCYLPGWKLRSSQILTEPESKGIFHIIRTPPLKEDQIQGEISLLRCSLLSLLSRPCPSFEDRLSLTDGKPAAVLRLAAKWDRGEGDLMGCGIGLKGYERGCTSEDNEWWPSWRNSSTFHHSINRVEDLEKQATAVCRIPELQLNLRNCAST